MRDVFEHVEAKEQLKLACPLAKESDGVGSEFDGQTFLTQEATCPTSLSTPVRCVKPISRNAVSA